MIFSREEARRVLRGAQTMDIRRITHTPKRDGHYQHYPYPPGSIHAITVRGLKRDEPQHLIITGAAQLLVGQLGFAHAQAMGHRTTPDMRIALAQRWKLGQLDEETGTYLGEPRDNWPVWALSFEIARDLPRLLRAGGGREGDHEGDYTVSPRDAMVMEAEAVDKATQERITTDARTFERQRVERETRPQVHGLALAIATLEARSDIGETAARRLRRMRTDLAHLQNELRAA